MTEELQSQLDYFKEEPVYLRKVIEELKQENKQLSDKYDNECIRTEMLTAENKELYKALEDIREMTKYDCEYECCNNSENCIIDSCLEKRIERLINEVVK